MINSETDQAVCLCDTAVVGLVWFLSHCYNHHYLYQSGYVLLNLVRLDFIVIQFKFFFLLKEVDNFAEIPLSSSQLFFFFF